MMSTKAPLFFDPSALINAINSKKPFTATITMMTMLSTHATTLDAIASAHTIIAAASTDNTSMNASNLFALSITYGCFNDLLIHNCASQHHYNFFLNTNTVLR